MKVIYPQIDESKVRAVFRKRPFSRKNKIVKVEANYLPCYLFELRFKGRKGIKTLVIICDGLKGKVRRIEWPQLLSSSSLDSPATVLDEVEALEKVKEQVRWITFRFGLKINKKYSLEAVHPLGKIGYPFWIVYYKRNGAYNFLVHDGLSGKKENHFAKDIFMELFGL
ncbi:MAG: hypothetical protein GTO17_10290 [Candidatus Aminicenantes bacterium]|nr:hypothetical protein [Candidatus Aminicenantes bacterium]